MAASQQDGEPLPEGVFSILDTDLYKFTMQCAILKFFPSARVGYGFTNRTPHMKLTRGAFNWLRKQIDKLANIQLTSGERTWLRQTCPYLTEEYLEYLSTFRFRPDEHLRVSFTPSTSTSSGTDDSIPGDVSISIHGLWLEAILYEVPLLALVSEAYFRFVDRDWNHDGQVNRAQQKGTELLRNGCVFSEFGSRRRRDYKTHSQVMQGLVQAQQEAQANGWSGKFSGTSNVHFAMRFGVPPIGTVAHEWFMGIAAVEDDYANANEKAMRYWIDTFGRGVLGIALTDTFGTRDFLRAFARPAPLGDNVAANETDEAQPSYAQVFTGVRQDSGDPLEYMKLMKDFYAAQGITDRKVIVYSDSLNVEKCIKYKEATDAAGLAPSFGIGTFFTNDFARASSGGQEKSVPLNIVIKLSEGSGRGAVKLSDNKSKNTGDPSTVDKVKSIVGYEEREWKEGDEAHRWDK